MLECSYCVCLFDNSTVKDAFKTLSKETRTKRELTVRREFKNIRIFADLSGLALDNLNEEDIRQLTDVAHQVVSKTESILSGNVFFYF